MPSKEEEADAEMAAENEDAPETPKSLVSKSGVFSEQCSPAMIRIEDQNDDQKFYVEKENIVSSPVEANEEILIGQEQGFFGSEAESGQSEDKVEVK